MDFKVTAIILIVHVLGRGSLYYVISCEAKCGVMVNASDFQLDSRRLEGHWFKAILFGLNITVLFP